MTAPTEQTLFERIVFAIAIVKEVRTNSGEDGVMASIEAELMGVSQDFEQRLADAEKNLQREISLKARYSMVVHLANQLLDGDYSFSGTDFDYEDSLHDKIAALKDQLASAHQEARDQMNTASEAVAELESARETIVAYQTAMSPRQWSAEQNDAWHRKLPDMFAAFDALHATVIMRLVTALTAPLPEKK